MRLDPNPLFRRIIIPWYDSTPVCWVVVASMVMLMFFSITGIMVAGDDPEYNRFAWVPWVLLALGLVMGLSVTWRLIQRRNPQKDDEYPPGDV